MTASEAEKKVKDLWRDAELYAEWYFVMRDKESNPIGGGATPEEAWLDAAQRMEGAE